MTTTYNAECESCSPLLTVNISPPHDILSNHSIYIRLPQAVTLYAVRFTIDKKFSGDPDRFMDHHYFSRVTMASYQGIFWDDKLDDDLEYQLLMGYVSVKVVFDKGGLNGFKVKDGIRITFFPSPKINFEYLRLGKVMFEVNDSKYIYQAMAIQNELNALIAKQTITRQKLIQKDNSIQNWRTTATIVTTLCIIIGLGFLYVIAKIGLPKTATIKMNSMRTVKKNI